MKKNKKRKLLLLIPVLLLIVCTVIIAKEIISLLPHIKASDTEYIKEELRSYGVKGAIFICVIQTLQLIIGVIPSGFIQVVSGVTYGTLQGGILSSIGVLLGATIIYALVNVFKVDSKKLFNDDKNMQNLYSKHPNKHKITFFLFTLFLIPAVPYGLVCYYAATQKISFRRYLTISFLATLPSIYLSSLLGTLILESIGNNFVIVLVCILIILALAAILAKVLSNKQEHKNDYIVKKPNGFLYFLIGLIVMPFFKFKNNVKINNKETKKLKGPYLVLCNHPSRPDFIYSIMCLYPTRVNVVAARYYFYNKRLSSLLRKLGVIPKNLFNPDIETVKNIINVIKNDGVVLMMPEGRLSATGELEKMPDGTDKLIKKLKVPVVTINLKGAHLTGAKWMKKRRRGRIEVESKILLTPEEIESNSCEYIENKIKEHMHYNDYKWNKEAKVKYKGKDLLDGVTNILYLCPHCHKEFTLTASKNTITCTHCNKTYTMDNYYQIDDSKVHDVNDWYKYQIQQEINNLKTNPEYTLETQVILKMPTIANDDLVQVGEGTCTLNKDFLTYTGTINNEKTTKVFDIKNIPALPFGCEEDFEIYANNTFFYFSPIENKQQCAKWSIIAEAAHDLKKTDSFK